MIDVQTATTRISAEDETTFEIVTPARIYTILCPSAEDRLDWIKQINHAKTEVSLMFQDTQSLANTT